MKNKKRKIIEKVGLVIIGFVLILSGVMTITMGQLHYSNYWEAPVFAPFSILVGILIIILAIFKSGKL